MKSWTSLFPVVKRLFSYGKPHKKILILAILILWIAAIAEVAGPMIISYFIDYLLPQKIFLIKTLILLILIFFLLQIISSILRYYQALLFNRAALNVVQKLRTEVMDAALCQPLSIFDTQPVGQLISRVTNDTEVVKDLYITVVASVLRSIALIIAMLIAMFLLNWHLACISLILFPIVIIVMWLYQRYSTPIVRKLRSYVADINDAFNEAINGMGVIQQFRQQKRFGMKLRKASYAHLKTRMETLRLEGYLLRPLLSFMFTLILSSMLFIFWLRPSGEIGVGILYAFINYLSRLNEPLIELTSQQSIMQQAVVAGERIFELMDRPKQCYGYDKRFLVKGNIKIKNLSFNYRYENPILENISITIPENSFVALVGNTGSGKSTLGSLIMGHYPVKEETLFLDDRPIETLSHNVLRRGVSMVQQDPIILAETIYNNIVLGRNSSEKIVWNILRQVQLAEVVKELGGLNATLGEQGNNLSIGQKQLIALARILISSPKILILDEATANIDFETEQVISRTLRTLQNNTTLIVIAHRLSTIIEADQIIVLRFGKIVERGTHSFLLKKKGYYHYMHQLEQFYKDC